MLNRVTITGADDDTPISWMLEMSAKYPFVEWGILVSQRAQGSPRFPGTAWMVSFVDAVKDKPATKVSMHVCGAWVREFLVGRLEWERLPIVRMAAARVQINTHAEEHVSTVGMYDLIEEIGGVQFIFQLDGVNNHLYAASFAFEGDVAGLFDSSHGRGLLPHDWPEGDDGGYYGYAGGLGPENVVAEIARIERKRADAEWPFWIDMEGRIRDEQGRLDLKKVEQVLALCAPLVGDRR